MESPADATCHLAHGGATDEFAPQRAWFNRTEVLRVAYVQGVVVKTIIFLVGDTAVYILSVRVDRGGSILQQQATAVQRSTIFTDETTSIRHPLLQ